MNDGPPLLDQAPDPSVAALQALAPGPVYCQVAGSGPTFPVAQRRGHARTWLHGVGMSSQVGAAAADGWLAEARSDVASFSVTKAVRRASH